MICKLAVMWLKFCLLLLYVLLLFVLSRVLEAISLSESGYGTALSRQLLDPMVLSVVKLKALLEQRGVSYEGVVEKSELTSLVDASGQVSAAEAEMIQQTLGEDASSSETNFTSGAHFIEQVEDAKDSVWLVQVISNTGQTRVLSDHRWRTIQNKASKFGVRTGLLDCSLDIGYCHQKGWRSPFLLLALPSQFEKKANVAMYNYSGSVRETVVLRWVRDKLDERVIRIQDPILYQKHWQNLSDNPLDPEIRAVMFTETLSAPLFYSALSLKFPGRVKFGLVSLKKGQDVINSLWKQVLRKEKITSLPAYVILSSEKSYTYGMRPGEQYSFSSMELFFKSLYPCLNDIFIISFCIANIMSWFELFISNCSICRRIQKFVWCMFKYNIVVIMLWLPVIGIFQMPYLDRVPLIALKLVRNFSTSSLGTVLRGDYTFYLNNPAYVYSTFLLYLAVITVWCKKYRQEEMNDDDWFNFSQMRTLTHLRPNDFFEPMRVGGYDLMGGLEVFGSQLSQPSLWLQPSISPEYIKHLPTWRFCPVPLAARAAANVEKVESALSQASESQSSRPAEPGAVSCCGRSHTSSLDGCGSRSKTEHTKPLASHQQSAVMHGVDHSVYVHSSERPSDSSRQHLVSHSAPTLPQQPKHQPSGRSYVSENPTECKTVSQINKSPPLEHHSHDNKLDTDSFHTAPSSSEATLDNVSSEIQPDQPSSSSTSSLASESTSAYSVHPPSTTSSSRQHSDHSPSRDRSSASNGFPFGYLECHQCVICLDEFTPLTMLCGLPCGHVFHETCIISWLNREKHFCPMCRWPSYKLQTPLPQS